MEGEQNEGQLINSHWTVGVLYVGDLGSIPVEVKKS